MEHFSDPLDKAAFNQQRQIEEALRTSKKKVDSLRPTGECHNPACGDDVESPKLFCNRYCAEEYERYKRV